MPGIDSSKAAVLVAQRGLKLPRVVRAMQEKDLSLLFGGIP